MHESEDELIARLQEQRPSDLPSLSGSPAVQAWVVEFGVAPGRSRSLETSDLYRHFLLWCWDQGHLPKGSSSFSNQLQTQFGLTKGRYRKDGRDTKPFAMAPVPATYFRKWLEDHPTPIGGRLPNSSASRVERELLKLGVKT